MKRRISSIILLIAILTSLLIPLFSLTASAEEESKTLSFSDKSFRTSFSTSTQVWEQNGIKFTNNKGSSTSNVADYANPVRLYAKSNIIVEAPGNITKIVFDCNSSTYATALKNSIGAEASASSDKVTVILNEPSTSYKVSSLTAQVRLDSLTVTYEKPEEACQHSSTSITTESATCTAAGSTTEICDDCGETVSSSVIAVLGHDYSDGVCKRCGAEDPSAGIDLDGKSFYIATKRQNGNYLYMTCDLGDAATKRYQAVDSGLSILPVSITDVDVANVFVFQKNEDGTYLIYAEGVETDNYLGHKSEANDGLLVARDSALSFSVTKNEDGTYKISFVDVDEERSLELNNSSNYFAFYKNTQIGELSLIPLAEGVCYHNNTVTTVIKSPTCTEDGEHTVICQDCGNPIGTEKIPALGHTLIDDICINCGYAEVGSGSSSSESEWTLVTDVNDLKQGDQIVIVAKEYDYAMGTTQNGNNRAHAKVTKSGNTITFGNDVQIFTLSSGKTSGTFAFYTGAGYLYAASSSGNYLRTETTLSNNSSWAITIDADGTASIIAQGTYTRNVMQYNQSSALFACYGSASQKPIVIYKLSGEDSGSESVGTEFIGASMSVGSTLAMNYYVTGCTSDHYMIFSMNDKESEKIYGVQKGTYFVFSFTNIPPQFMGDEINAVLYSQDGEIIAQAIAISVKEYASKVLDLYGNDVKISNLVADMLKYGAAAQEYRNYKTDSLVTDGIDLNGKGNTIAPTNAAINVKKLTTAIESSEYFFTQAGVRFDFDNKLYVKFTAKGEGTVTLRCNGKYVAMEEIEDGIFVAYSSGISATEFDKEYKFELYVDGNLHQTVTYSVNSYIYTKYNDGKTTDVDALVIALYSYGLSAKEYKNA